MLAVVPADHCIPDRDVYARTMRDAAAVAEREHALLTIGIEPRYADPVSLVHFSKVLITRPALAKVQEMLG